MAQEVAGDVIEINPSLALDEEQALSLGPYSVLTKGIKGKMNPERRIGMI